MIKKWATVISWQNEISLVSCNIKTICRDCIFCQEHSNCILSSIESQTRYYTISIPSKRPLVKGQKIELGITESFLLTCAMMAYFLPLLGLFIVAILFQLLFSTDFIAMCGGVLGGVGGFLVSRSFFKKLTRLKDWQVRIINVDTSP